MTAIKTLKELYLTNNRVKYPSMPEYARVIPKYTDRTANGLTKCIIDYLRLNGCQAERINSMGRPIDKRKTYTDVIGRTRTIGRQTWIKTTGTNGTADISATIAGRSVKIEVKIGNDRQSEAQKAYQKSIENSGGVYVIAKDFESFIEWFNQFTKI